MGEVETERRFSTKPHLPISCISKDKPNHYPDADNISVLFLILFFYLLYLCSYLLYPLPAVKCWVSALRISVTFLDVGKCLWHIPQRIATSSLAGLEQESWTRNNGCKMHCGIGCEDSVTIKQGNALRTLSFGTVQHHILHRQLPALPLHCGLLSVQHDEHICTCMRCFVCLSHKARLVG